MAVEESPRWSGQMTKGLLPHATKVAAVLPRIKGACVRAFFLLVGVAFTVFTTHRVEVVVPEAPWCPFTIFFLPGKPLSDLTEVEVSLAYF